MSISVVGIGQCKIDYFGIVPQYPAVDREVELMQFSIQGGGHAANTISTLARLGNSGSAFIGKLSNDQFGEFLLYGMSSFGVHLDGVILQKERVSPFSFTIIDKKTHKRQVFSSRGDIDPLSPQEIPYALLDGIDYLYMDGHFFEAQFEAAKYAKARKAKIVLQIHDLNDQMETLISLSDYLILSEKYAMGIVACGELDEGLKKLREKGPSHVVITLADEGCIGIDGEGNISRSENVAVNVVDTTGAGDIFAGAFIHGLIQKWSHTRCMHFANATAALSCRELGVWAGIPTLDDILKHTKST